MSLRRKGLEVRTRSLKISLQTAFDAWQGRHAMSADERDPNLEHEAKKEKHIKLKQLSSEDPVSRLELRDDVAPLPVESKPAAATAFSDQSLEEEEEEEDKGRGSSKQLSQRGKGKQNLQQHGSIQTVDTSSFEPSADESVGSFSQPHVQKKKHEDHQQQRPTVSEDRPSIADSIAESADEFKPTASTQVLDESALTEEGQDQVEVKGKDSAKQSGRKGKRQTTLERLQQDSSDGSEASEQVSADERDPNLEREAKKEKHIKLKQLSSEDPVSRLEVRDDVVPVPVESKPAAATAFRNQSLEEEEEEKEEDKGRGSSKQLSQRRKGKQNLQQHGSIQTVATSSFEPSADESVGSFSQPHVQKEKHEDHQQQRPTVSEDRPSIADSIAESTDELKPTASTQVLDESALTEEGQEVKGKDSAKQAGRKGKRQTTLERLRQNSSDGSEASQQVSADERDPNLEREAKKEKHRKIKQLSSEECEDPVSRLEVRDDVVPVPVESKPAAATAFRNQSLEEEEEEKEEDKGRGSSKQLSQRRKGKQNLQQPGSIQTVATSSFEPSADESVGSFSQPHVQKEKHEDHQQQRPTVSEDRPSIADSIAESVDELKPTASTQVLDENPLTEDCQDQVEVKGKNSAKQSGRKGKRQTTLERLQQDSSDGSEASEQVSADERDPNLEREAKKEKHIKRKQLSSEDPVSRLEVRDDVAPLPLESKPAAATAFSDQSLEEEEEEEDKGRGSSKQLSQRGNGKQNLQQHGSIQTVDTSSFEPSADESVGSFSQPHVQKEKHEDHQQQRPTVSEDRPSIADSIAESVDELKPTASTQVLDEGPLTEEGQDQVEVKGKDSAKQSGRKGKRQTTLERLQQDSSDGSEASEQVSADERDPNLEREAKKEKHIKLKQLSSEECEDPVSRLEVRDDAAPLPLESKPTAATAFGDQSLEDEEEEEEEEEGDKGRGSSKQLSQRGKGKQNLQQHGSIQTVATSSFEPSADESVGSFSQPHVQKEKHEDHQQQRPTVSEDRPSIADSIAESADEFKLAAFTQVLDESPLTEEGQDQAEVKGKDSAKQAGRKGKRQTTLERLRQNSSDDSEASEQVSADERDPNLEREAKKEKHRKLKQLSSEECEDPVSRLEVRDDAAPLPVESKPAVATAFRNQSLEEEEEKEEDKVRGSSKQLSQRRKGKQNLQQPGSIQTVATSSFEPSADESVGSFSQPHVQKEKHEDHQQQRPTVSEDRPSNADSIAESADEFKPTASTQGLDEGPLTEEGQDQAEVKAKDSAKQAGRKGKRQTTLERLRQNSSDGSEASQQVSADERDPNLEREAKKEKHRKLKQLSSEECEDPVSRLEVRDDAAPLPLESKPTAATAGGYQSLEEEEEKQEEDTGRGSSKQLSQGLHQSAYTVQENTASVYKQPAHSPRQDASPESGSSRHVTEDSPTSTSQHRSKWKDKKSPRQGRSDDSPVLGHTVEDRVRYIARPHLEQDKADRYEQHQIKDTAVAVSEAAQEDVDVLPPGYKRLAQSPRQDASPESGSSRHVTEDSPTSTSQLRSKWKDKKSPRQGRSDDSPVPGHTAEDRVRYIARPHLEQDKADRDEQHQMKDTAVPVSEAAQEDVDVLPPGYKRLAQSPRQDASPESGSSRHISQDSPTSTSQLRSKWKDKKSPRQGRSDDSPVPGHTAEDRVRYIARPHLEQDKADRYEQHQIKDTAVPVSEAAQEDVDVLPPGYKRLAQSPRQDASPESGSSRHVTEDSPTSTSQLRSKWKDKKSPRQGRSDDSPVPGHTAEDRVRYIARPHLEQDKADRDEQHQMKDTAVPVSEAAQEDVDVLPPGYKRLAQSPRQDALLAQKKVQRISFEDSLDQQQDQSESEAGGCFHPRSFKLGMYQPAFFWYKQKMHLDARFAVKPPPLCGGLSATTNCFYVQLMISRTR